MNRIKLNLQTKHKAANQHLHEVSEYLKTLNTYYNKQLIDGMVKSKEKFNKSKSVVNQKYINFHEYASAINKHSAAIKQIYRDYLQHIKQFKHNMKNAHQTFHKKVLTSNPRFWNYNDRVRRKLNNEFKAAMKLGLPVNRRNYNVTRT